MTSVTVTHNSETAHRLPQLEGKCQNLHGHSWQVSVTVAAPLDEDETVIDFGLLKRELRGWIDSRIDHGAMLSGSDPLVTPLTREGSKVFVFNDSGLTEGMHWPTVENVAELIKRVMSSLLTEYGYHDAAVTLVRVTETDTNSAEVP